LEFSSGGLVAVKVKDYGVKAFLPFMFLETVLTILSNILPHCHFILITFSLILMISCHNSPVSDTTKFSYGTPAIIITEPGTFNILNAQILRKAVQHYMLFHQLKALFSALRTQQQ